MLVAWRHGQEFLIPLEFRAQFHAQKYAFRDAPSGLAPVSAPIPLADAKPLVASASSSPEAVASPSSSATASGTPLLIADDVQAEATPRRRRGGAR